MGQGKGRGALDIAPSGAHGVDRRADPPYRHGVSGAPGSRGEKGSRFKSGAVPATVTGEPMLQMPLKYGLGRFREGGQR